MVDYVTVRKGDSGLSLFFEEGRSLNILSENFAFTSGPGGTIHDIRQIEKAKDLYISPNVVIPKNVYFEGTVIVLGSKIKTNDESKLFVLKDCIIANTEIILTGDIFGLYAQNATIESSFFENAHDGHYVRDSQIFNCDISNDVNCVSSEVEGSEISFANIADSKIVDSKMSSSTISGSNLKKTQVHMSRVTSLCAVSSEILFSTILDSTFENVVTKESTFEEAKINSGKVQDSHLTRLTAYASEFVNSNITDCKTTLCNLKSCSLEKCIVESSSIKKSNFFHIDVYYSSVENLYHKKTELIRYNIENASISCALDFVIVGQSIAYKLHSGSWRVFLVGTVPLKFRLIVDKDEIPKRPDFEILFPKEYSVIAKSFYESDPTLGFFVSLFSGEVEEEKQDAFMVWLKKYIVLTSVAGAFEISKKTKLGEQIHKNMKLDIKNGVFTGYVPILNEETISCLVADKIIKSGMYDLLQKKKGIVKINF